MSEICKCCGGGDNGEEHLDWCDTPLYDRIEDLEQQLAELREENARLCGYDSYQEQQEQDNG